MIFFSFVALDELKMMKDLLLTWKTCDFIADIANYLPPWLYLWLKIIEIERVCGHIVHMTSPPMVLIKLNEEAPKCAQALFELCVKGALTPNS